LEEDELERGWDRLGLVGIGYRELYRRTDVHVGSLGKFIVYVTFSGVYVLVA